MLILIITNLTANEFENDLTSYEKDYLKNREAITMCIDPDWMPFESFDKNGKHVGISADYFAIFRKMLGIDIKPIYTKTWGESVQFAKERQCDILSLAMETPDRKQYFNFTDPYLKIPLVIATKVTVPFVNDISSIKDKRVGITKGYAFAELLKKRYPNLNIVEVDNIQNGLKQVYQGKLFGYIGTLAAIGYQFQKGYSGVLKVTGKFNENWKLGIAVRNDDKTLFDIFQKAVNHLDTKEQQKILNDWISIKYEKSVDYTLVWEILLVVFVVILLFIYRQYILKKANDNLEHLIQEEISKNELQQKQLFAKSRLAQMGEMISMIAHQWRQPLGAISTTAINLKVKLELESLDLDTKNGREEASRYFIEKLENIETFVDTLTHTIDDFRNFYKPNKESISCKLEEVFSKAFNIIKSSLENENIDISYSVHETTEVSIYSNEIMQVLLNILKNAQDNFKEKKIENPKITIAVEDKKISICDNGGGIKEDIIEKIFDPYFSTKNEKNGTGLGLYMSKIIIEEHHNGKLKVENRDNGVCFSIDLKEGELDD